MGLLIRWEFPTDQTSSYLVTTPRLLQQRMAQTGSYREATPTRKSEQTLDDVLYPEPEAHKTGMLEVSPIHSIYWEVSGNPSGVPVIVLHGGPGGGSQALYRRYFDPSVYMVVQMDQRGCGK